MALGREKGEAERGLAWFRGRIVARGFQSVKRRCAKTTWAEFPTGRLSSNGFNVASPLSRHFFSDSPDLQKFPTVRRPVVVELGWVFSGFS